MAGSVNLVAAPADTEALESIGARIAGAGLPALQKLQTFLAEIDGDEKADASHG